MKGPVPKREQPLTGVKCVVNNCRYHKDGDYCSASQIEIQSKHATKPQETDCATFTLK